METITTVVKDVEKNASGWYEVTIDDDRVISTKNQDLADAAFAGRGSEVEIEINAVQKGKYTNLYLNRVGDLKDEKKSAARGGGYSRSGGGASGGGGKSPDQQRTIEREWAYGRATELFASSNVPYALPLTDEDKARLDATADYLLSKIK